MPTTIHHAVVTMVGHHSLYVLDLDTDQSYHMVAADADPSLRLELGKVLGLVFEGRYPVYLKDMQFSELSLEKRNIVESLREEN